MHDTRPPYNERSLLSYEAVQVACPLVQIDPRRLRPTQEFAVIERLLALHAGAPVEGDDIAIHVVEHRGALYVHNGHHRWLLDLLGGKPSSIARVQRAER